MEWPLLEWKRTLDEKPPSGVYVLFYTALTHAMYVGILHYDPYDETITPREALKYLHIQTPCGGISYEDKEKDIHDYPDMWTELPDRPFREYRGH